MSTPVTHTLGTVDVDPCPTTYQELAQAIIDALTSTVPGSGIGCVVQMATPAAADRDKVWVKTASEPGAGLYGNPVGIYLYSSVTSSWYRVPDMLWYAADTGADPAYVISITDAPSTISDIVGRIVVFKASFANTGAATLKIGSYTAYSLKKYHDQDLVAGDIEQNQMVACVWDGSVFQVISQLQAATEGTPAITSFLTAGSGNWTVPAGITHADVECIGAGGGGGYKNGGPITGGGGGGYNRKQWNNLTAGTAIPYVVGAKGTKSTGDGSGDATSGGDTTFNTTQIANGGSNGDAGSGTGGGQSGGDYGFSGTASYQHGTNRYAGGKAAHAASNGGWCLVGGTSPIAATVGGGGAGDDDSGGGSQATDGADGAIIIRYW